MYILKSQTLLLYYGQPSSEVGAVLHIIQLFYCNHLSRSSLYEISTSASLRELQSAIRGHYQIFSERHPDIVYHRRRSH